MFIEVAKKFQEPEQNLLMEIATLAKATPNLIDLSLGDPDITTDDAIINASTADAKAGHTHYTASDGSQEFLQAIVDFYHSQYNLSFQTEQVRGTVGALHGMYLTMQALLNPGDEVIIHEPYFSPYKDQIILAGGQPVIVPTYEKDDFQLDVTLLEQAITKKTKAIIINSPNNPTGAVFSKETLKGIAALAEKHDIIILADEVYEAFCYEQSYTPMATFAPNHTITFSSFSKTFAMTGWRIGYMIAPAHVNLVLKQINESVTYSAPTLSQQAGIYALTHYQALAEKTKTLFAERLAYIQKRIETIPFLSLATVKGSIYAFVNIEKTGLTSVPFTEKLVKETQVLVIPGEAFGESGKNYVRIAATQDLAQLKEAFDRIEHLTF